MIMFADTPVAVRGTLGAALAAAFAAALPPYHPVRAQDTVLAPVVVQATRLPAADDDTPWPVSVVEGERVSRARQGLGLDEALLTVPGLYAQNRYNLAQDLRLSIRGFGARATFGIRGLKLIVDGVPATLPDGQAGVDALDLHDLDRIEVIRGPAASLYGAAAGGVVSLISRAPPREPTLGTALSLGSHGFAEQRVHAGGTAGDVSGIVSASHLSSEGYRRQSRAERSLLNARASVALAGGGELAATLSALDSPTAEDPGALTAAQRSTDRRAAGPLNLRFHSDESVAQQRIGVTATLPTGSGELSARAWGLQRDFASRLPFQAIALDRIAGGGGVQISHELAGFGTPMELLAGIDLDHQDDARERRVNDDGAIGARIADQRERVSALGAFVQLRARPGDALLLNAALRADRVRVRVDDRFGADGDQSGEASFAALSPSAGAVLALGDRLDLYANAATAFETPTTAELADPGGAGGFNSALESQRALSLETGLRGRFAGGAARYELAAFHIRVEDQLVAFAIPGAPDRFAFQNAGRSRHLGLEAALALQPSEALSLRAAWTWSRFEFRRFTERDGTRLDGRTLPGVPRHVLALEAEWRPADGWLLAADAQAVTMRFADSANSAHAPGYVLLNARAGYTWRRGPLALDAHAGIDNLLDTRYDANLRINAAGGRYFEPAPSRGARMGLALSVAF
jgi:iron complex outermembrane receptor protein